MCRMLLLVPALGVWGCSTTLEVPKQKFDPARLRIVNAAPATTTVSARIDQGAQTIASLAFKGATDCILVTDGLHEVSFAQGSNSLGKITATFASASHYTVVLTSNGATFRVLSVSDELTVAGGNNGIRLVNASSTAGDVYVTPPGEAPSVVTRVAANLAPLALVMQPPPYVIRPQPDVRVRLFDVNSTINPRSDFTLGPPLASRLLTVVFNDKTNETDPGAFQVDPCH